MSTMTTSRLLLTRADHAVRDHRALSVLAVLAGIVFVIFGVGKFTAHGSELASFRGYGLPAPAVTVVAIGILEIAGGLLLIARRGIAPVAVLLAANMLTAIAVSGFGEGEVLPSLTLAPALLAIMLALLVVGLRRGEAPAREQPAPSRS